MRRGNVFKRNAGILMAISSLPSPYGIGTLGKEAYEFIDFVRDTNHKYWQVLPVGPTTYGDSPYQPYSAFAGNPYFVDLDTLIEDGLLLKSEVIAVDWEMALFRSMYLRRRLLVTGILLTMMGILVMTDM